MGMVGRQYNAINSYRFGFNGKENDNEVKGEGNQQDYGMRIYDPRLGKFLSVDPLQRGYPMLTPYQFASNGPIDGIDLDGLEYYSVHLKIHKDKSGKVIAFELMKVEDHTKMTEEQFFRAHKRLFFPSAESKTYESQGEGVLYIYYDEGGEVDRQMASSQSSLYGRVSRHGIWSGEGAPTQFGPIREHNYVLNPYVGMGSFLDIYIKPVDEVDNIAFIHDKDMNVIDFSSHHEPRWLEADVAFVANLVLYLDRIKKKGYQDEFTKHKASAEAKRAAKRAIKYFLGLFSEIEEIFVGDKKDGEIPPKLEQRRITKAQLERKIGEVVEKMKKENRKYATKEDVQF